MKTSRKKLALRALATVFALLAGLAALTYLRRHRRFVVPPPSPLAASADPALIERGRYLVEGPGHCRNCHAQRGATELTGGFEFELPIGTFRVPNITPDAGTGIGRYSDAELVNVLRYGVRPDGTAVPPFMPFANVSDQDLRAILSYLRAQPAREHHVAPHDVNALGDAVLAWVIEPKGPIATPPALAPQGVTLERGRYLARSVANCVGCHTKLDLRTGGYAGTEFGGGDAIPSMTDPKQAFVPPNLTPDPRWGWISGWSEETFLARMKAGELREGSPMPWQNFAQLTDDDMRALFRYLRTLPTSATGPDPQQAGSVSVVTR